MLYYSENHFHSSCGLPYIRSAIRSQKSIFIYRWDYLASLCDPNQNSLPNGLPHIRSVILFG